MYLYIILKHNYYFIHEIHKVSSYHVKSINIISYMKYINAFIHYSKNINVITFHHIIFEVIYLL